MSKNDPNENNILILGMGRVGLPLALYLDKLKFNILGIDINKEVIKSLNKKIMIFNETGCDKLLKNSNVKFSDNLSNFNEYKHIIITVGTPLMQNIETDLSYVKDVIKSIAPKLKKGQNIILRSTVAPRTTIYVKNLIHKLCKYKVGKDIGLSFCPERLAENNAIKELKLLPQIIGSDDKYSKSMAEKIFNKFKVKIFNTSSTSAELVKLFNNASRYIDFATANQFAIIANRLNQNIHDIIKMANFNYPRGYIHKPGLAAGTCLRKDFGFINELNSSPDLFLTAWKINEYMPMYICETINEKISIKNKNIGILGYTFKKDSDDTRDSLVEKLTRYIERYVPNEIIFNEPNLKLKRINNYLNTSISNIIKNADIIIIAVNHKQYTKSLLKRFKKDIWIVDLWNCTEKNKLIFKTNSK